MIAVGSVKTAVALPIANGDNVIGAFIIMAEGFLDGVSSNDIEHPRRHIGLETPRARVGYRNPLTTHSPLRVRGRERGACDPACSEKWKTRPS